MDVMCQIVWPREVGDHCRVRSSDGGEGTGMRSVRMVDP